ncbi:MAG TPA: hypothetical protein VF476_09210 [Chitinophagaceae bacterium]
MKKYLLVILVLAFASRSGAQKVDSIYFHLYTDSLKKGQHNYINVDGKMSDGRWQPLTTKELEFSSTHGKFEGNELILPFDFKEPKLKVKAVLKSNPAVWIEKTIWIKTIPDPDILPTNDQILNNRSKGKKNRN